MNLQSMSQNMWSGQTDFINNTVFFRNVHVFTR